MKIIKATAFAMTILMLTACQTAPRSFNGTTGYQIESKTENQATLVYTLSGRADRDLDVDKLQRACKKVLGENKSYQIAVLSTTEIINPQAVTTEKSGVQLGQSHTS